MWTSKRHYNLDTIPINHIKKLFKRLAFQDITSPRSNIKHSNKIIKQGHQFIKSRTSISYFSSIVGNMGSSPLPR